MSRAAALALAALAALGLAAAAPAQTAPAPLSGVRAVLAEEVRQMQAVVASLEARVAGMGSCCGCCNGTGGKPPGSTTATTTRRGPVAGGNRTTTIPPVGPSPALCAIFGDPHFITFDGGHTTFVGERVIWLVKTDTVWLQALSRDSDGKFMGFAAGGAFLRGHSVIIYNDTQARELRALFDGQRVLSGTTDYFNEPGILEAHRDDAWNTAKHNARILELRTEASFDVGEWEDRFLGRPKGGLFLLKLPDGIEVTISGVDLMSAVVTMPRRHGAPPQGGYCGNHNGDPQDDFTPVVPSWNIALGTFLGPVSPSLDLFRSPGLPSLLAEAASAPVLGAGRGAPEQVLRALRDTATHCPESLRRQAERECAGIHDVRFKRDCFRDICLTGDVGLADTALAAEVMEKVVNAKGIPLFMGHGRCLDSEGQPFTAFETGLRTDAACRRLLRSLSTTHGVLGAQLQTNSTCQVLVAPAADPRAAGPPGLWLGAGVAAPGRGLVGNACGDASWTCWALN